MRNGSASNPMNRLISAASRKKAVKVLKKELHPPDLPNPVAGHREVQDGLHQKAQEEAR